MKVYGNLRRRSFSLQQSRQGTSRTLVSSVTAHAAIIKIARPPTTKAPMVSWCRSKLDMRFNGAAVVVDGAVSVVAATTLAATFAGVVVARSPFFAKAANAAVSVDTAALSRTYLCFASGSQTTNRVPAKIPRVDKVPRVPVQATA